MFKLFKKKKKEVVEEPQEDLGEDTGNTCNYCGLSIYREQQVKTFGGKKYHLKPCWRSLRKDAVNEYKGN